MPVTNCRALTLFPYLCSYLSLINIKIWPVDLCATRVVVWVEKQSGQDLRKAHCISRGCPVRIQRSCFFHVLRSFGVKKTKIVIGSQYRQKERTDRQKPLLAYCTNLKHTKMQIKHSTANMCQGTAKCIFRVQHSATASPPHDRVDVSGCYKGKFLNSATWRCRIFLQNGRKVLR